MAFRNEHGALRERIEALERDLREAREKLERRTQDASFHEARAKELERELEAAREELARHTGSRGAPNGTSPLFVTLGVALAASVGIAYFLGRGAEPASAPVGVEAPSSRGPASTPAPAAPPEPRAIVHAARVSEVRAWPPLRPGDECRVESELTPEGSRLRIGRIAVRCGETTLYDSAAPPTGFVISNQGGGALERPSPEETGEERFVYLLQYQDQGSRALPMAQIIVDTQRYQARVFRSPESEGVVVLDVDSWSAPVAGPPLLEATRAQRYPFRAVVSRALALRSVEGAAPIGPADSPSCSLEIRPEPEGSNFNCRVLVRCGPAVLYGARISGYNRCDVEDGAPVRAHDAVAYTDGDPELRFDLTEGSLSLRDDPPEGAWSATFSVEPSP